MSNRPKVLFLCAGHSCRSQMAKGWARHLKGGVIEPYSAGIETHGLNPLAVKAMAEAGVDISGQRSKHVSELRDIQFDYVVTVCGWEAPVAKRREPACVYSSVVAKLAAIRAIAPSR